MRRRLTLFLAAFCPVRLHFPPFLQLPRSASSSKFALNKAEKCLSAAVSSFFFRHQSGDQGREKNIAVKFSGSPRFASRARRLPILDTRLNTREREKRKSKETKIFLSVRRVSLCQSEFARNTMYFTYVNIIINEFIFDIYDIYESPKRFKIIKFENKSIICVRARDIYFISIVFTI